jgi:peptidoglycan/LPS O-acetylase OafA/YrhL
VSTALSQKVPAPAPEPAKKASSARLAWLDALRGIAALAVVYTHFALAGLPEVYHATTPWIIAGTFGVLTFFVISGYIVPASLERKGSVRAFWISRLFRLYPLWLFAMAAVLVLTVAGLRNPPAFFGAKGGLLLSHFTMLQELLTIPSMLNVMWTLSYEMVFYFLVAALFSLGLHRRSAEISVGFGVASLVGGAGLLPSAYLVSHLGWKPVLLVLVAVFVLGLALAVSGRKSLVVGGSVLLGAAGLLLLAVNQHQRLWFGFLLPATMFLGTAIYRAEHRQIPRWKAIAATVALLVIGVVSGLLHNAPDTATFAESLRANRSWLLTLALTAVAFAVGMALRHRRIPRFLTWLGVVSYSTYLLHPLVYQYKDAPWFAGNLGFGPRLGYFVLWVIILLAGSWATYRFVEAPFQRMGRRVTAAVDQRFGPDATVGTPEGARK